MKNGYRQRFRSGWYSDGGWEKEMAARMSFRHPVAFAVIIALLLAQIAVITDYIKIEDSFTELRFQIARIGSDHDESLPRTVFLTDWPDVIALTRKTPYVGMRDDEIDRWQALMIYNTSPLAIRKVIGAYKLNGNEAEARAWALRACWLLSEKACAGLYDEWQGE